MPLEKEKCTVGLKVQDSNGNVGIVRWIGRMEKAQKPPNKDVGTYAAVEYEPNTQLHRTDGTWEGQRYCTAPAGSVEFVKPKGLDLEQNEAGVAAMRKEFGEEIADWSDLQVTKFLIARKYDYPKVIIMIKDHLKWRAEFQPSHDEAFPPEMGDEYPTGFGDGVDREGNLLYFERPGNGGKVHPKDYVAKFGIPRIMRWHACGMETGRHKVSQHPTAKRVTTIIDLKDMGDTDSKVREFGKGIAKIDQDNYPEHLNKLFIINASTSFVILWKILRVFVDDRTKNKIHILGKDYPSIIEQQIERKYWPSFIGGTDDSWLKNGGRVGSNDPSKMRDPDTGKYQIEPLTEEDEAKALAEKTPKEELHKEPDSPAQSP